MFLICLCCTFNSLQSRKGKYSFVDTKSADQSYRRNRHRRGTIFKKYILIRCHPLILLFSQIAPTLRDKVRLSRHWQFVFWAQELHSRQQNYFPCHLQRSLPEHSSTAEKTPCISFQHAFGFSLNMSSSKKQTQMLSQRRQLFHRFLNKTAVEQNLI